MYKPKNQWIISFEGSSDCTGKTSLINAFNKATNYNHLLDDRRTLSTRAYSIKFNRTGNGNFKKIEQHLASYPYHLLVYLTASKEDVKKRQDLKNDGYNANDYDLDKELFDKCLKTSKYKKIIKLNSSKMTVDEEVNAILEDIMYYELIDDIKNLALLYSHKKKLKNRGLI